MEKHFVNYNQALALKELGFDEPCLMYIDEEEDLINDDTAEWIGAIKCPLKSQVFDWFRNEHNIQGYIYPRTIEGYKNGRIFTNYVYTIKPLYGDIIESDMFESYEEAESACIDKLIELVKKK